MTVEPHQLLPKSTLVVHVSDRTLLAGDSVGRADKLGPVTMAAIERLLSGTQVTVRPVFDPGGAVPVDCYEIPADIRRAALLRHRFDVFPYGTRPSGGLDLDHTEPYRWDGPPGQTRVDNLGPLTRRAHRAKTHGGWRLTQPSPGRYCWTSPLGRRYIVTQTGLTLDGHPSGSRPWDDPLGGPLLPEPPQQKRQPKRRRQSGGKTPAGSRTTLGRGTASQAQPRLRC